jgi:hypothetical protein
MTRLASCAAVAEHTFCSRKKDGKRFKFAQFGELDGGLRLNRVYLQEV